MRARHTVFPLLLTSLLGAQSGWSTPTLLTTLNTTASDTGGHLSADGLTLHWVSYASGNWEIYSATRPTRTAPWSAPNIETLLNDPAVENEPHLAADGLSLYFGSMRTGGAGSFDILVSTRASTSAPWSPPTFVTEVNSSAADSSPSITEDGLELYFLTTGWGAPFAPQNAIFVATRTTTSVPFSPPTLVAPLSTPNTHRDVEVAPDGLSVTYTEYDSVARRNNVWIATRTSRALPFNPPSILTQFSAVGTSVGVYTFSRSRDGLEVVLAALQSVGSQELMTASFDGLTTDGAPSTIAPAFFHYRDSANPGRTYALALSGGNTGFPLGARNVPIDPDGLFMSTFGVGLPPFSGGFLGILDAQGQGLGSMVNPLSIFAGLPLFAGAFTLDFGSPFGVRTISNAVAIRLH